MAERWGPVRSGNSIGRIKSLFKYGTNNALIERPVRFRPEFKKPGKAILRRHKATNGNGKMMEAEEIRKLLDATANGVRFVAVSKRSKKEKASTWGPRPDLRAALLLMVNAGFGPIPEWH